MTDQPRDATLYRMVMKNHLCPFGLKSLDLLKREGFTVVSWVTQQVPPSALLHIELLP